MINEIALVLLFSLFGWKIAGIYIASGLIIAIVSGLIIQRLPVEHLLSDFIRNNQTKNSQQLPKISWPQRVHFAQTYTRDILKKIWPYILIGVGVGA